MFRDLSYNVLIDGSSYKSWDIEINDSYKSPVSRASFSLTNADKYMLNNTVEIYLGFDGSTSKVFDGYIDNISYERFPGSYEISCSNILKLAEKHFIVTEDLEEPWTRENIAAEALVEDLLEEAGITSYVGNTTGFTFGVSHPVEFNMISVMDAINQIKNILAYNIYAQNGTVYFDNIQPVPGTPTSSITNIISHNYNYGTKDLRNKVVVFGRDNIYAEASESSPYLPENFYQTAIVSSELIDQQSMADSSAEYNLDLYNKLNRELKIEIEGNTSINVRDTVNVSCDAINMYEDWFVYSVRHYFSETFVTELFLRK